MYECVYVCMWVCIWVGEKETYHFDQEIPDEIVNHGRFDVRYGLS